MTFKVAVSSYHVVYVDGTDDEDEGILWIQSQFDFSQA